ncbi:MAG: competence/damage-inducible protein A [Deltaproteobacteria bacterium]|nr:competence/damage-inducible protein A [Deltaproteobacteria bacterium]
MHPKISYIAIGSELLDGRVLNRNAKTLSQFCIHIAPKLHAIFTIDDVESEIQTAIKSLSKESDIIIITGGLGPTSDDLTREAVANLLQAELVRDEEHFDYVKNYFAEKNIPFVENNHKVALIPSSCTKIKNPVGTAAGFYGDYNSAQIFAMPGIPVEFIGMMHETVLPLLEKRFSRNDECKAILKCYGMPESGIADIVEKLDIPTEVTIAYQVKFPEIHIILSSEPEQKELLSSAKSDIHKKLKDIVYSENFESENLMDLLAQKLQTPSSTLEVIDSATSGRFPYELRKYCESDSFPIKDYRYVEQLPITREELNRLAESKNMETDLLCILSDDKSANKLHCYIVDASGKSHFESHQLRHSDIRRSIHAGVAAGKAILDFLTNHQG